MKLGYVRGNKINQQLDHLENYGVEELFSDGAQDYRVLTAETSEYASMLDFAEAGDQVVIGSWEVISRDYHKLLLFLEELERLKLELVVLNQGTLTLKEWRKLFLWSVGNDRLLHPQVIKIGAEKNRNKNSYSIFSKDHEAKKLYRDVIWQLIEKQKITQIAKNNGVPLESVYRIKQEFSRMKLAFILSICFILAIVMIKVAESFSDNLWLQLGICIIATLIILYNTLTDSGEF